MSNDPGNQTEVNTSQASLNAAQAEINQGHTSESESLRQEIEALSTVIVGTKKSLDKTLEDYQTRDEIQTARRRTVAAVVAAVLIAVSAGFLLNNWAITTCFFKPHSTEDTFCNTILPGYNEFVVRNRERSLNSSNRSKENRERIEELEAEVDRLNQIRIEELENEIDSLQKRLGVPN